MRKSIISFHWALRTDSNPRGEEQWIPKYLRSAIASPVRTDAQCFLRLILVIGIGILPEKLVLLVWCRQSLFRILISFLQDEKLISAEVSLGISGRDSYRDFSRIFSRDSARKTSSFQQRMLIEISSVFATGNSWTLQRLHLHSSGITLFFFPKTSKDFWKKPEQISLKTCQFSRENFWRCLEDLLK